ncbi:MAG: hypothetical protein N3A61_06885 [Ignavibacteria bacterium]|nr:hypothetical protein [Ignavibacteria bacterium]
MKFNIKLLLLLLSLFSIQLSAEPNTQPAIRYSIIIDFGRDYYDPLFSEYTMIEFVKERMSQRLPEFVYTDNKEEANMIVTVNLLTQTEQSYTANYISALNLFISSYLHSPFNQLVLLFENKEETMKSRIRDYIDRWLLEYSVFIYKKSLSN